LEFVEFRYDMFMRGSMGGIQEIDRSAQLKKYM